MAHAPSPSASSAAPSAATEVSITRTTDAGASSRRSRRRRSSSTSIADPRRAALAQAAAPLDHHCPPVQQLVQAQLGQLRKSPHAVEIDVRELELARVHAQRAGRWG